MKKSLWLFSIFFISALLHVEAQNVAVNTSGAAAAATNMFEVTQTSTAANMVALYAIHSGASAGTGYGFQAIKTGASATNVAGYFSATGATNNYAGIFENGNVGIGLTAPLYTLHLSSANAWAAKFSSTAAANGGIYVNAASGFNANIGLQENGVDKWYLGNRANDDRFSFINAGGATEVVTILQGGNVGIGPTAPSTKLHIDFDAPNTTLTGTTAYGGIHLDQSGTADEFTGITASATSTGTQGGILFQGSGAYGTKIHFLTTNSYAAGMQQRMIIDHVGNVGIATTSPGAQLEVAGTGELKLSEASPQIYFNDVDAGAWRYWIHNNGNRLYFLNDGGLGGGWTGSRPLTIYQDNVGVGTATPGAKLEVAGQVKITGGSPALNSVLISDAVGLATWSTIAGAGGVTSSCGTLNYVPKMSTATAMLCSQIFDNGTNVGIGTTTGNGKLNVSSSLTYTGVFTNTGVNAVNYAVYATCSGASANTNTGGLFSASGASTNYGIFISQPGAGASNYAIFSNAAAQSYFNGNVGIGTTAPGAKLEVAGQVKITGGTPGANKVLTSDAAGLASWQTPSGGSEWTDAGAYLYPADGAAERVSIGTTSGAKPFSSTFSKLFVYNDANWLGTAGAGATVCFYNDENVNSQTSHILDLQYGNATAIGADDKFIRFIRGLGTEVGSVNSEVTYSTFTGAHVGQSDEESDEWLPGMIVSSHGNPSNPTMGRALVKIGLAKVARDKAAIGVYTNKEFPHRHADMDTTRPAYYYNALGEGLILVTDLGGDIAIGDYITTSNRPGYGMKQNDDLLHNYTVAKATDSVKWAEVAVDPKYGFKWKLVACTYHGG